MHIKSSIKELNSTSTNARNVAVKSALKTSVRRFEEARCDPENAVEALKASRALDKAASKLIHKNKAARKIRMAKKYAQTINQAS